MSKYEPLRSYLESSDRDRIELSFEEISAIVPGGLPPSAYRHQAWWANETASIRPQIMAWRNAGFRTERLDLVAKRITFRRES